MKIQIAEKIANALVDLGTVPLEDKELYEYGIRQGILLVINIITAALIGLVVGMAWQSMVFLIVYYPIRSYAGGYHANHPLTCYLFSIPLILIVLMGIKLIPWNNYAILAVLVLAGLIIGLLAPVEDFNKPLDQIERKVYRRKTLIYLSGLSCIIVIALLLNLEQIALCLMMAAVTVSIMLILGVIKNRRIGQEKA